MVTQIQCPNPDRLQDLFRGCLPEQDVQAMEEHLLYCSSCAQTLDDMLSQDTLCDALQDSGILAPEHDAHLEELKRRVYALRAPEQGVESGPWPELAVETTEEQYPFLTPALMPGELGRFGKYRVLKVLGVGGMGVVYQAEDTRLKRQVALKVMKPAVAVKRAARERFLREAQAAAALEHENIVTIHHVDEEAGIPYIAMQCLRGQSLDERLKETAPLTVPEVLTIGRQVADGLAAAHERGLIHRDIKPANIWLEVRDEPQRHRATEKTPKAETQVRNEPLSPSSLCLGASVVPSSYRVKILDFGLARALADDVQLTQSGTIIGTPAYMAPEQARGERVDTRCDLFSLGVVLYRLCTGRLPFRGDTSMAILSSLVLDTPPAPQELNPAVPTELSDLIEQLIAKDSAHRPASAIEVAKRLQAIAQQARGAPPPTPPALGAGLPTPPMESALPATASQENMRTAPCPRPEAAPQLLMARRRRRILLAAAAVLLVLGPLGYFFGGTIIRFATNQGELVIQVADKDVEVKIVQNGVIVHDRTSKREFTLIAGNGEIEVLEKDGVKLATKKFELTRGGKTTVTVTWAELADARKPKDPPLAGDPDRRASEWVLSIGGTIRVDDQERDVRAVAELPKEPFRLTAINLQNNQKVTDAGLAHLKDSRNLMSLTLHRTQVTDVGLSYLKDTKNLTLLDLSSTKVSGTGLAHLKDCKNLTHLFLNQTPVTDAALEQVKGLKNLVLLYMSYTPVSDAGLAHVKELKNLIHLSLSGTRVSDAGLTQLKELRNLGHLTLENTRITEHGIAELKKALSKCQIDWTNPDRRAAEWVLSLGGTIQVNDQERDVRAVAELPKEPFRLTAISLQNNQQVTDAGLAHFKDCKNLTVLNLQHTAGGVTAAGLAHFKDCKNLTVLNLHHAGGLTDAGLAHFQDCKKLTRLDVCGTYVSDAGLAHFRDCKNLMELNVWATQVSDAGLAYFKDCKGLTSLNLSAAAVTDAGLAHFKDCQNLQVLVLWDNQVTDAGLAHLKNWKHLTGLFLNGTRLSEAGLAHLKDCKELTQVSLYLAQMPDAWLAYLKDFGNLTHLGLSGTQVSDAGLAQLQHWKNLTSLHLDSTPVTDVGLAHLKALSKLKVLWLDGTKVSANGVAALKKALPNCTIAWADPDRRAAEWVLSIGGTIAIRVNDRDRAIKAVAELPNEAYLLTGVHLWMNQQVTDAGLVYLKGCKSLEHLDLRGTPVTNPGLADFEDFTSLKNLWLNDTRVNDAGLRYFRHCKNLQSLQLWNTSVGDTGLAHFKDCKDLTSLGLNATQVTDAGLAHFKSCKNLADLSLPDTRITDAGLAHFKDRKNLGALLLGNTQVSDAGLAHFQDCKNLSMLYLDGTRVGDLGLAHLKGAKNLTTLSLTGTQVSDAGLANFSDSKNLAKLYLHGTRVSDRGLAHFKDHKNLSSLHLSGTRVSDACLQVLAGLPKLDMLEVNGSRISRQGYEQLKAALPTCSIHWYEPNRKAAEDTLTLGGAVEIGTPGKNDTRPVKVAAELPKEFFQVRKITLKGKVSIEGFVETLSQLQYAEFDRLETLDLSSLRGGIDAYFAFLPPIHGLKELTLAGTGLTDDHLSKFPKLPALRRLVLDDNPIRGPGLGHLSNQPELIDLSLNCPTITDLFAKNLAELKRVKRLSLVGASLTDAGIRHLEGLTNLTFLDLSGTKASAEGIAALQKALPKCKIGWDGTTPK